MEGRDPLWTHQDQRHVEKNGQPEPAKGEKK